MSGFGGIMKISLFVSAMLAAVFSYSVARAEVAMVKIDNVLRPAYKEGEVIVKFRDGAVRPFAAMDTLYKRVNALDVKRFSGQFKNFEHLIFDTTHLSVEQAVADLQRDPMVEYAQPNYMLYASSSKLAKPKTLGEPCMIPGIPYPPGCEDNGATPTPPPSEPNNPTPPPGPSGRPAIPALPSEPSAAADPDLAKAWGIAKTSADKAWAIQKGSKNVVVAVIDTGVDYTHPDLAYNIWRKPSGMSNGINIAGTNITGDVVGWDFVHNDNLPFDDNDHGTHCAGVIGAVGNDGKGISGINQRVSIMAVKFLSGSGSGDTASAVASIDYAVSRGAKVLSNSWGGKGEDDANVALKDSVARAGAAGVLFVAAAGNDGTDNDSDSVFPASYNLENMITVAATNENDGMAFFSNKGAQSVHVGAPGTNVYSTTPGNKYKKLSGTSMACPHVAGQAALVWAQYPNADFREIKRRILGSGDALSALNGKTVTGKRINVEKSLMN